MISNKTSVIARKEQITSVNLNGEAVLLNLKSGIYYGLDEVGARIWDFLQEPTTIQAIKSRILEEYDVDEDRCEQDLQNLIAQLQQNGLVEFDGETTP